MTLYIAAVVVCLQGLPCLLFVDTTNSPFPDLAACETRAAYLEGSFVAGMQHLGYPGQATGFCKSTDPTAEGTPS